jgi:pimeloyl-ACP methyl ester carboxylesterase
MPSTLVFAAALAAALVPQTPAAPPRARNVVLVHGAVMDGSSWRPIYERLTRAKLRVTMVQLPLTSLAADVAATKQAIARQDGPTVLVGHSYGGAVISAAGDDPKISALVYVAAFQPDVGEAVAALNARWPLPAHPAMLDEGTMIVDPAHFREDVGADLPPDDAAFLAAAQRPTSVSVFGDAVPVAAWHGKPRFGIVATRDRTISPDLLRDLYRRSGTPVVELDASHLVQIARPDEVTTVILRAAGQPGT